MCKEDNTISLLQLQPLELSTDKEEISTTQRENDSKRSSYCRGCGFLGTGRNLGQVLCSFLPFFQMLQPKFLLTSVGVNLQARGMPNKGYAFRKHDKTCWMLWKTWHFHKSVIRGRSEFLCLLSYCFALNCLCCLCDGSSFSYVFLVQQ